MKTDISSTIFMRTKTVFADAFNAHFFNGRQVINADELVETDTVGIALPHQKTKRGKQEKRYRDLMMQAMTDGKNIYALLGIENQTEIHYAMPVRNMLYDAISLSEQVSEIASKNRLEKKATNSAEYLSGFLPTDKLIPVITLVILWNKDKWDGPTSLKEMYIDGTSELDEFLPDYKINLISPGDMADGEFNAFQTSLGSVLKFVKYSENKAKLKQIVKEDKNFKNMSRDAVNLLNDVTGANITYSEDEEEVDMCVAIQEMIEDGFNDGKIEGKFEGECLGIISTCKRFNVSLEETVANLSEQLSLPMSEAMEIVKKNW